MKYSNIQAVAKTFSEYLTERDVISCWLNKEELSPYKAHIKIKPRLIYPDDSYQLSPYALQAILGLLRHGDIGNDYFPNEIIPCFSDTYNIKLMFKSCPVMWRFRDELKAMINKDWFMPRLFGETNFMYELYMERLKIIEASRQLTYRGQWLTQYQVKEYETILNQPMEYLMDLSDDD